MKVLYDSVEDARDDAFVFELRHGDRTVAQARVQVSDNNCMHTIPDPTSAGFSFCAYDSGDLRYSAAFASRVLAGAGRACVGEGPCAPKCNPGAGSACAPGTRCTSRVCRGRRSRVTSHAHRSARRRSAMRARSSPMPMVTTTTAAAICSVSKERAARSARPRTQQPSAPRRRRVRGYQGTRPSYASASSGRSHALNF